MTHPPESPVIYAVYCMHCQVLSLLTGARACDCDRAERAHAICGLCAALADPEHLGDILLREL